MYFLRRHQHISSFLFFQILEHSSRKILLFMNFKIHIRFHVKTCTWFKCRLKNDFKNMINKLEAICTNMYNKCPLQR